MAEGVFAVVEAGKSESPEAGGVVWERFDGADAEGSEKAEVGEEGGGAARFEAGDDRVEHLNTTLIEGGTGDELCHAVAGDF